MGRVKKEFNKNGAFQHRLREQFYKKGITQESFAEVLGVTRPTVSGWILGNSIPDVLSLEKIARYFDVSADYLLGISDTISPDVSVQAATAYTGLSEKAIERLHMGLDDFICDGVGPSDTMKVNNLRMASALIQNSIFTDMIHRLLSIFNAAYAERIMTILDERYLQSDETDDDPDFQFATNADRAIFLELLTHFLRKCSHIPLDDEYIDRLKELDDDILNTDTFRELLHHRESNQLNQFHAAKAFSRFIDLVEKGAQEQADKDFQAKQQS